VLDRPPIAVRCSAGGVPRERGKHRALWHLEEAGTCIEGGDQGGVGHRGAVVGGGEAVKETAEAAMYVMGEHLQVVAGGM
jgi:hypothetical protein